MKTKSFLIGIFLILFAFSAFAQEQTPQPHWSDLPSGIYSLKASGKVRVIVKTSKKNFYDFGTDLKNYISTGQEAYGTSFVENGKIIITPQTMGSASQIRLFLKDQLMDIELSDGALLVYDSRISQPSMKLKLINSKLYSEKSFGVKNFVLDNIRGVIDLKKANINSAILNLTPETQNNIEGSIDKQQIYIKEE